jgi:hypothetical protein
MKVESKIKMNAASWFFLGVSVFLFIMLALSVRASQRDTTPEEANAQEFIYFDDGLGMEEESMDMGEADMYMEDAQYIPGQPIPGTSEFPDP